MAKQSEQILEEQLITQLQKLGYGYITLNNEAALLGNLKNQLEKHNNISLKTVSCFEIRFIAMRPKR